MSESVISTTIVGLLITEAIGFLFLLFKTIPVHDNRLTSLEGGINDFLKYRQEMESRLHLITRLEEKMVAMTRESNDKFETMRRSFDEERQTTKEITRHLQRAVEDNMRAIISLEATMKQISTRL